MGVGVLVGAVVRIYNRVGQQAPPIIEVDMEVFSFQDLQQSYHRK
jgi:hypothetical protein